jgi:dimeric dUTPase (all-alpha-NTP-PPase superfamily)
MLDHLVENPRTREIVKALVENQSHLNYTAYSESWLAKGATREFHYLLAASQELAEFVNSYWLPWWSKAERDMANCRIELVDALHFLLSEAIIQYGDDAVLEVSRAYDAASYTFDLIKNDLLENRSKDVIDFARGAITSVNEDVFSDEPLDMTSFFMLCLSIEFDLDKLSALYMGKSTLNKFRQDNGYRAGTYKKKWDGVHEDNHFMSVWIAEQRTPPSVEQIRVWLETEYAKYK